MRRARLMAVVAAAAVVLLSGCSAPAVVLSVDQAKAAELTADQLGDLGGTAVDATIPDFTAAELVALASAPEVVEPDTCRDYVTSLGIPGQVIVPSEDADSTDTVLIPPHVDAGAGTVDQSVRVLPDAATATALVADLRGLASGCGQFQYGATGNVNRFTTVATGDLPFDGDGYRSTIEVKGTKFVVATDEIYVMQVDNVVATVRGTAGQTQPFAQALSQNLRAAAGS